MSTYFPKEAGTKVRTAGPAHVSYIKTNQPDFYSYLKRIATCTRPIREAMGLSRAKWGVALGIPVNTISTIELGYINEENLRKLFEFFMNALPDMDKFTKDIVRDLFEVKELSLKGLEKRINELKVTPEIPARSNINIIKALDFASIKAGAAKVPGDD